MQLSPRQFIGQVINLKGGIVVEFSSSGKIDAEFVSIQSIEVDEIIILTGGLKAWICDDMHVQLYPMWIDGEPIWSDNIPCDIFPTFLKDRDIDIIGIKQNTRTNAGTHWRWAPAKTCHNPPNNNPSYRWTFVSNGVQKSLTTKTPLHVIGENSSKAISERDTRNLANLAKHISIDLHQLNHAIVMMAEHLHKELVSHGPRCGRYSHIRNIDLSAYVHGYFQAFSAARDHYAQFIAIQIGRKRVEGDAIDSMSSLLNAVEPSQLRQLRIIRLLEQKSYLEIGEGRRKHEGKSRLVYSPDTWLKIQTC